MNIAITAAFWTYEVWILLYYYKLHDNFILLWS